MTSRQRNAWIWLAVAALSIAVAARAQTGVADARACSGPMLKFLAAHAADQPAAAQAVRLLQGKQLRPSGGRGSTRAAAFMLPVLFVGVVSPLDHAVPQSCHGNERTPHAPTVSSSFQRPPPQIL
ncbi:hypothetical protein DYQ86_12235 [Acidobacteria bacterium AB60]|nr:hypothetical protein DYQ86_12235 [Acidobacteria bacterium AB60]